MKFEKPPISEGHQTEQLDLKLLGLIEQYPEIQEKIRNAVGKFFSTAKKEVVKHMPDVSVATGLQVMFSVLETTGVMDRLLFFTLNTGEIIFVDKALLAFALYKGLQKAESALVAFAERLKQKNGPIIETI